MGLPVLGGALDWGRINWAPAADGLKKKIETRTLGRRAAAMQRNLAFPIAWTSGLDL